MADGITFFLWFVIYSFLGWVWETTYCSIKAKRFINRGFLNGPIIPVYGFGAVFVMIAMSFLKYSPLPEHLSYVYIPLVFVGGVVVCTVLEYITAVILESAFHIRWWDYSKQKFNFQGRICLKSSLFFGLGSVVILYLIQPMVSSATVALPSSIEYSLAAVFLAIIAVDFAVTLSSLLHLRKHLSEFHQYLSDAADDIRDNAEELKTDMTEFFDGKRRQIRRLARAFPTSVAKHSDEAWQKIKEQVGK